MVMDFAMPADHKDLCWSYFYCKHYLLKIKAIQSVCKWASCLLYSQICNSHVVSSNTFGIRHVNFSIFLSTIQLKIGNSIYKPGFEITKKNHCDGFEAYIYVHHSDSSSLFWIQILRCLRFLIKKFNTCEQNFNKNLAD